MNIKFEGISQFFWFAIPAVLALAALWWLAFAAGLNVFTRTLSQEHRAAEYVGAKIRPKEPMTIVVKNSPDNAVQIDRVNFDGGDLWVYYRNTSQSGVENIQFQWKQIAPDGTVVKADDGFANIGSENDAPDSLDAGERGEMHRKIDTDPRSVKLVVSMSAE